MASSSDPKEEHIDQFEKNAIEYIRLLYDIRGKDAMKVYEHLLVCRAPKILKVPMFRNIVSISSEAQVFGNLFDTSF